MRMLTFCCYFFFFGRGTSSALLLHTFFLHYTVNVYGLLFLNILCHFVGYVVSSPLTLTLIPSPWGAALRACILVPLLTYYVHHATSTPIQKILPM
jgi:hypothetical protein